MVESIEAFCAEHNESVDTVVNEWTATKFEALNEAFRKRMLADALDNKRSLELSSLLANGNFESEDSFANAMSSIGNNYGLAIAKLYDRDTEISDSLDEEFEIDMEDPLFKTIPTEVYEVA